MGIENKGLFFAVNVGIVVLTRFIAGRFVDLWGARRKFICQFICPWQLDVLITGSATSEVHFFIELISFTVFGAAIGSPAVMAWTADLANPIFKGRGMGTMFIALELGFLSGNFIGQQIYQNNSENFFNAFLFGFYLRSIRSYLFVFDTKKEEAYFELVNFEACTIKENEEAEDIIFGVRAVIEAVKSKASY